MPAAHRVRTGVAPQGQHPQILITAMSSKSLLIVDDSRVSRMLIRTLIATLRPDWSIREAVSAQEAIDGLGEHMPDYVTMDINMPGMLGIDAAERIAQDHPGRLRIVLFSANVQGTHQARATAMGMKFVGKPVSERSVSKAIAFFEESV